MLELRSADEVAGAIARLAVRGAPMLGVAGAYGVAIEVAREPTVARARAAAALLRTARPTAANLAAAVDEVLEAAISAAAGSAAAGSAGAGSAGAEQLAAATLAAADAILAREIAASAALAEHGADWLAARLDGPGRVLTHCNTGALAVPGVGSALGVIGELHRRGLLTAAIATESRPLLQGARLTVWELQRRSIPHELIVDAAAAGLIAAHYAAAVVVGCDRVAANGDVANKVGTYGLALAAHAAGIPFVVAGPISSIDPNCLTGGEIVIEERDADEVRHAAGRLLTLHGTHCRNPAFDVTPAALISALVTDAGVACPVDPGSIASVARC